MDEPTLEQQIKFLDGAIGPDSIPAATIRRHAELVRLCREWQAVKDVPYEWASPEYERYNAAEAALVAAIGREP